MNGIYICFFSARSNFNRFYIPELSKKILPLLKFLSVFMNSLGTTLVAIVELCSYFSFIYITNKHNSPDEFFKDNNNWQNANTKIKSLNEFLLLLNHYKLLIPNTFNYLSHKSLSCFTTAHFHFSFGISSSRNDSTIHFPWLIVKFIES